MITLNGTVVPPGGTLIGLVTFEWSIHSWNTGSFTWLSGPPGQVTDSMFTEKGDSTRFTTSPLWIALPTFAPWPEAKAPSPFVSCEITDWQACIVVPYSVT